MTRHFAIRHALCEGDVRIFCRDVTLLELSVRPLYLFSQMTLYSFLRHPSKPQALILPQVTWSS